MVIVLHHAQTTMLNSALESVRESVRDSMLDGMLDAIFGIILAGTSSRSSWSCLERQQTKEVQNMAPNILTYR